MHHSVRNGGLYFPEEVSHLEEYTTQTSSTLRKRLEIRSDKSQDVFGVWSTGAFGCVLLADISGFTKLANSLDVESLKFHINNLFTVLIGCIERNGGDVVKFCGDAILVTWTTSISATLQEQTSLLHAATSCGLQLMKVSSQYNHGDGDAKVSLRLHCGLSAGELHMMCVGDSVRKEFLISGSQLKGLGVASSEAKTGDLCLTPYAYSIAKNDFKSSTELPMGSYRIDPPSYTTPKIITLFESRKHTSRSSSESGLDSGSTSPINRSNTMSLGLEASNPKSPRRAFNVRSFSRERDEKFSIFSNGHSKYESVLSLFVHQSARPSIIHNTTEYLTQLRHVVTIFIQILNLDEDFNAGLVERPQLAFEIVLKHMEALGGAVRQYVVDDKGCVIICNFGVPGFSCINDSIRAIYAAHEVVYDLNKSGIECRVGIASGMAYCGYVGSKNRMEYGVMGSSVNLAARLMGLSSQGKVLVSGEVFLASQGNFSFDELPRVKAKGYTELVPVYEAMRNDLLDRDQIFHMTVTSRKLQVVGFERELMLMHRMYKNAVLTSSPPDVSHLANFSTSFASDLSFTSEVDPHEILNHCAVVISGDPGSGKTTIIHEFVRQHADSFRSPPPVVYCQKNSKPITFGILYKILRAIFHHNVVKSSVKAINLLLDENTSFQTDEAEQLYEEIVEWTTYHMSELEVSLAVAKHSSIGIKKLLPYIRLYITGVQVTNMENDFPGASKTTVISHLDGLIVKIISLAIMTSESKTLIIEDLEWCDVESFSVIKQLVIELSNGFIVMTFGKESSEIVKASHYDRNVSRMPLGRRRRRSSGRFAAPGFTEHNIEDVSPVIHLPKMDRASIRQVVEYTLGPHVLKKVPSAASEVAISKILLHSCGGNPNLVIKQAESLQADIAKKHFGSNSSNFTTEEQMFMDAILERDRLVLMVASVCGPSFDRKLLEHIFEWTNYSEIVPDLGASLLSLLQNGIIVEYHSQVRDRDSFSGSPCGSPHPKLLITNVYAFSSLETSSKISQLMLEDQKQIIHTAIANYYLNGEDGHHEGNHLSTEDLEVVTHHISLSNNPPLEMEYAIKLADRFDSENMISKAYSYYSCVVRLACDGLGEFALLAKACGDLTAQDKSSRPEGKYSWHGIVEARENKEETTERASRYLLQKDLKRIISFKKTSLLSSYSLSTCIAKMSVLKFKECKFRESHNLFILALHLRSIKLSHPRKLLKYLLKKESTRQVFGDLFVRQAQIFLYRGHLSEARCCALAGIEVTPTAASDVIYIRGCALMRTISLLVGDVIKSDHWDVILMEYESDEMEKSFSYRKFHFAIKELSCGRIESARDALIKAATKRLLVHDFSPLRLDIEIFSRWINMITGNKASNVLFNDMSVEDSGFREVWMLEVSTFQEIVRGRFNEASAILNLLRRHQDNRCGMVYFALLGYFGVRFEHFASENIALRNECMESLWQSGSKLARRKQTSPMGILCLFIVAHSCWTILLEWENNNDPKNVGVENWPQKLSSTAQSCCKTLVSQVRAFPFLVLLSDALHMLQCCVGCEERSGDDPDELLFPKYHPVYLHSEFKLGCGFWYQARQQYSAQFSTDALSVTMPLRIQKKKYFNMIGLDSEANEY